MGNKRLLNPNHDSHRRLLEKAIPEQSVLSRIYRYLGRAGGGILSGVMCPYIPDPCVAYSD